MAVTELADKPIAAVSAAPEVQQLTNGNEGNGKRLSMRAKSLMVQLSEAGKTQTEIAQVLGCTVSTVSRSLAELSDNRILARKQLEANSPRLVQTIIKSKDAATALRTLQKLDVVRDEQVTGGTNIMIAIGQPGNPLLPPSVTLALSPPQISASALSLTGEMAVSGDQAQAKATPIEGVSPEKVA